MSDLKPNKFKFNDAKLKKLPLPEQGMALYYDTECKGLMLRITENGARTFVLRYRLKGREHHCKIGPYSITAEPDWSIVAARKKADEMKEAVRSEKDPLEAQRADREAPTVKELCDRFIAEHLPKRRPSTQYEYKRAIEHDILPALGRKLVPEVNDTDVERLHRKISERGARARANTVVMYLSSIFSRAIKWKMRPAALGNPCKGVEKNPEEERERFLEDEQIAKLMEALGKHEDRQASDILSLCLLTGARISEIRSMRWDQIDLASGIWSKRASSVKQKKPHRAHMK